MNDGLMQERPDGMLLWQEDVGNPKERDYSKDVKHTNTEPDCLGLNPGLGIT